MSRTRIHENDVARVYAWRENNRERYNGYMKEYMRKYRESDKSKRKQNVNTDLQSLPPLTPLTQLAQSESESKEINKEKLTTIARRVLSYLNEVGGKKFTATEANLSPIIARLKEGHTEVDCNKVIDIKAQDPDFQDKYFRPVTLFRASKFEGYLNERSKEKIW